MNIYIILLLVYAIKAVYNIVCISFGMTFELGRYRAGRDDIMEMNIADGLKEALVNSGLTRKQVLSHGTDELASILEIEQYVANLILDAAKK